MTSVSFFSFPYLPLATMNRRQLFDPQHLAELLGLEDSHPSSEAPNLLRFGRQAMATTFEVLLPFGTPNAAEAATAALDEIDRLESQLTVYREASEVSRLNQLAQHAPLQVEERLFDLLSAASRLTRKTQGAFDISVGALIKAWGFYRRRGRVPSEEERAEVREKIGMEHVALDPERRSVAFLRRGLEINLGAIGKGYALDRAGRLLKEEWGIASALLHGGHSSILALGSEPGSDRGWSVGLLDPGNPSRRLGVLRVRDQGVGTSAATFQHLEHEGRRLGHILDPRTAWPAEGMSSTTVLAPTAAEADALATAFFILGVEPARVYLGEHPKRGAILLPQGKKPVVFGIPPGEVEFAFPRPGRSV